MAAVHDERVFSDVYNSLSEGIQVLDQDVSGWQEEFPLEKLVKTVDKLFMGIADCEELLKQARIEVCDLKDEDSRRLGRTKVTAKARELREIKKICSRFDNQLKCRQLLHHDPALLAGQKANEDSINQAIEMVHTGNKTAEHSYSELLSQKDTIMGYSGKINTINDSLKHSGSFLWAMKNRDRKNRCIVTVMISAGCIIVMSAAFWIFIVSGHVWTPASSLGENGGDSGTAAGVQDAVSRFNQTL